MKKTLVSMVGVMAVVAAAAAAQQQTQPTAPQQPAQTAPSGQPTAPGAQAAPAGQAAPQQKKEIKDPAEYNAYVGAVQQSDPNAKVSALESFLQQYPNSVMKTDALELLMGSYQQTGNAAKMTDAANRLLQAEPSNLRALALLAYSKRQAAERGGPEAQKYLAEASQDGQRGLQALGTAPKPEGMSDSDWQKLKTQTSVIFNGAMGLAALQSKDYKSAQEHLRAAVKENANNLNDVYPLALAYLTATPPDDVNGLFFIARAANLAAGSPSQAQISDFGRKRYAKFHGSDQGWSELLAAAKTATEPPAGFTIAAAPPPPSPQEQAAEIMKTKPVKEMSFAEWQLILSSGNQQAADQVWNTIKGVPLQIQGQVISASPTKLELAASVDDIDAKRADVVVNMAAPIPSRLTPKVGENIPFEGTPVSYEPKPFVMTLSKGALLRTASTPAKRTPTRRRPRSSSQ
jgi:hypothetical protein